MALEVGSRIAHYDVTAKIGEGGMGEVYRARDTKLDHIGRILGVGQLNVRQLRNTGDNPCRVFRTRVLHL